jgi:hypothetical protein
MIDIGWLLWTRALREYATAYSVVSYRAIKFGVQVCFALLVGTLFVIGGYTILTSLMNL